VRHQFSQLKGERDPADDTPTYVLYGLPEGEDFRDPDDYVQIRASWLKIDGVAFSAPGFDLGESGVTIEVEQTTEGGGAYIIFRHRGE
jgi:hypothetical protein